jgi:hypothetical protein
MEYQLNPVNDFITDVEYSKTKEVNIFSLSFIKYM